MSRKLENQTLRELVILKKGADGRDAQCGGVSSQGVEAPWSKMADSVELGHRVRHKTGADTPSAPCFADSMPLTRAQLTACRSVVWWQVSAKG